MDNPFLKDAKEGASATEAAEVFHEGTYRGKIEIKGAFRCRILSEILEMSSSGSRNRRSQVVDSRAVHQILNDFIQKD